MSMIHHIAALGSIRGGPAGGKFGLAKEPGNQRREEKKA
jgi:hypothetical protein